ncbi:DUF695 domain-containing protein [Solitalea sp. MAHUQ-68]|uniref:DUF695 domain-containing protein n=1 Tax=Solitalea agri TaxID=2953739 RepID=A0A9X2JER5_9SPHI|nr:DUF695 domain-containing protein [Solitalea agri]MCO4294205.1 DUF695 domain-containing protein [Solitalea agri]
MNFIKSIFEKKKQSITSYSDFWTWFQKYERQFFQVVKEHKEIEKDFFDKLSPKLNELKDGYFYLTGMYDTNTVELILTADGNVNNIAFIEELINAAPQISGWKFTALKPELNIKDVAIKMAGYEFNETNIHFYSNVFSKYPDEIDITIVHDDLTDENKSNITNGACIFLENYLGELNFATCIDNLSIVGKKEAKLELIPIAKLKDFLKWRQKEFVEKNEGVRRNTAEDNYSILDAELESGNRLLAVINTDLLNWDNKASHPWIAAITLKFDGNNNGGLPESDDYELLNTIEEAIMQELKDFDGYLNIGRETANSERDIYFACKDFRLPSKVFHDIQKTYNNYFEIEYDIFKDKYWQFFERFSTAQ